MLPIRHVLRLCARIVCTRHVAYCHAPVLREPSSIGTFHQVRFTHEDSGTRIELGKLKGKLKLMFTCKKCQTRTSKLISKLAYNKGVVIVRCEGCKNNHLIADNLGWFSEISTRTNIERIMELKGETVRKVMNDEDGYYEAVLKEKFKSQNEDTDEIKSDNECSDKIKIIDKSQGS
ncbi:PREDICTED: DNL-type zinc finger protein-like [Trachymyrmex cornetzi]|uniref:DNL-type zinc finger protein n=1 Tax=Trachymyrmex cornetzi TaxID=471704 RepID=A0A151IUH7_9HYME|nr:PREDICTED: DNL-type zinc finger protein-like [Trachymyrmex cornetzi]KYN11031.1 DNL-type zinc finger protein [Trachymyrmex cornetzi]